MLAKNEKAKVKEVDMGFVERHYKLLVNLSTLAIGIMLGIAFGLYMMDLGFWSGLMLGAILIFVVLQKW